LLEEAISNNAKIHFLTARDDEKYVVIITSDSNSASTLRVFNLTTGAPATITANDSVSAADFSYLDSANPKDVIKGLTITDTTIFLNTRTVVDPLASQTPAYNTKAFVFVKQVVNDHSYSVSIKTPTKNSGSETRYNINTLANPTPANSSEGIRDDLFDTLTSSPPSGADTFTASKVGVHGFEIDLINSDASVTPFTNGGEGNDYLGVVWKEVSSISDLPSHCVNGFQVKVIGDSELSQDDYYVKFRTSSGESTGVGSWEEEAAPEISQGLDNTTLPHQLANTGLNRFNFGPIDYKNREAGDDNSNPHPSFTDNQIAGLFFFKNRLGFLSGSNIIMSEAGEFFNFYRNTVLSLLDSAPIDVSASNVNVSSFRAGVGFQENLTLFTENSQFVLKGGDILTPKTVSISPVTSYDSSSNVAPLALGSYIYFPFGRVGHTGVREYAVNATADTYDAVDITEHAPNYIPSNPSIFTGSTSTNHIVVGSSDEPSSLFVYAYFWSSNQKVLSSWSKFTFNTEIRGAEFVDDVLYIVSADDARTHLVKLPMSTTKDANGYTTYLDNRDEATVDADGVSIDVNSALAYDIANVEVYTDNGLKLSTTGTVSSVDGKVVALGTINAVSGFYEFYVADQGGSTSATITAVSGGTSQTVYDPVFLASTYDELLAIEGYENTPLNLTYPVATPPSEARLTLSQTQDEGTKVFVGHKYTMKYTFSEQLFKASTGNSKSPSAASKLMVRNGALFFDDTAYFQVKVTPKARQTYVNTFTPDVVGSTTIGELNLDSGFYRFPVFTKAADTTITIENDSALPSNFQSAEFESFVHSRSNRYG
jgi:3D (Asp-Asp-Asp) domain-containing protein